MSPHGPQRDRFAERAAQVTASRRRKVLATAGAILAALGLLYVVLLSPLLAVRDVDVVGVGGREADEIRASLEDVVGTPLARVDVPDLTGEVEARPTVESAQVSRSWPGSLEVDVLPRVPALAVAKGKGEVEIYDLEGNRIASARSAPKGVPTVSSESSGETGAHGVRAALTMLEALPEGLRERVSAVTVDAADQVSFTIGKTSVVWGDDSEPELKVEVIEVLLAKKPTLLDVSAPRTPVTR